MSTTTGNSKPHILIIPYPAQGHIIPLLDLTHHLGTTNLFTLTILTTPKNLPLLTPLLSCHPPSILSPLILPFPSSHHLPPDIENAKNIPPSSFHHFIYSLSHLRSPLLSWFTSHPDPPIALISDLFLGWTHLLASQLNIKPLFFSPSNSLFLSLIFSLWQHTPKKQPTITFHDLPHLPNYPWDHLSFVYRSYVKGEEVSEFVRDGFLRVMSGWGLIVNSFHDMELEGYFGYLKNVLGHDRVWAVGPLIASDVNDRGGSTSVEVDRLVAWLDTCRDDEVVYVSFGTQSVMSQQQMDAMADGLDQSGVRFIWSVQDPVDPTLGTVPKGFEERVLGRGLVIKGWAPQVMILKHRAVGVMFCHCGSNSMLEAIMSGVEIVGWPMWADQYSNAKLIVDYLKVGVRVCEGPSTIPDSTQLGQVLFEFANRKNVDREKIVQLRNSAIEAVKENGSSSKDLSRLVKSLIELKTTTTTYVNNNINGDLD